MIDNIELIKPLLNFTDKDDFYQLFIFKRKKDQTTDKSNHQSVRTIKSYSINSLEYLEARYDEIKMLAEVFKARVYIHVQKQNHKDVGLNMIKQIIDRMESGNFNQKNTFDSVVGQLKTKEKRWIVDIDTKDLEYINNVENRINNIQPTEITNKIEAKIPTKNGLHLITKPFNVDVFSVFYPEIDIQKKNPTLLYYPSSLEM